MKVDQLETAGTRNPRDWGLAPVAMLLALLCLLDSGYCGESSRPPHFLAQWAVAWALCFGAVGVALVASRLCPTRRCRLWAAISIVVAVASSWISIDAYNASYHDYPWPALTAIFGLTVVGGAFAGQRILAAAAAVFCAFWFYGAFVPPASGRPASIRHGDLIAALAEPQSGTIGWLLHLSGPPGADLSRTYDVQGVRVSGRIGWAIPVTCWPPSPLPTPEDQDQAPDRADLGFTAFVPSWARSWDATVEVPVWPRKPAAHVEIPVARPNSFAVYEDTSGPIHLTVSDVRWGQSTGELPPQRCLAFTVKWSGYSYGGYNGREIRISEENGRSVPYRCEGVNGEEGNRTEIDGIGKAVETLRIDAYTEAQRERNKVVFTFPRLPRR